MGNLLCGVGGFRGNGGDGGFCGYECARCGNHVCAGFVKENGAVCPHCLGRVYLTRN